MQNPTSRQRFIAAAIMMCAAATSYAQVDPTAFRIPNDVNGADTTNAEVIHAAPYNLTGTGLTVGVWEAGLTSSSAGGYVRTTHQELSGRVTIGDTGGALSDHATAVAGIIAASGVNSSAIGMATNINIKSYTAANDLAEMGAAAGTIVAANNSYSFARGWTLVNWGAGNERSWFGDRALGTEDVLFGKYDTNARNLDLTLAAHPNLLSVWSAGDDSGEIYDDQTPNYPFPGTYVAFFSGSAPVNGTAIPGNPGFYRVNASDYPTPAADGNGGTGFDSLAQQQVAKNNLVVGAINQINTEGPGRTGTIAPFSSRGPTDDGRMGVMVVGDGVGVLSSSANSDSAYVTLSGTSMAAANVTGTMALVIQHLMQVRSTSQIPLAATSKALAIHTAHDILTTGPDYTSGYGVVDGEAAVQFIDKTTAPNPTAAIVEGSYAGAEKTYNFTATGGALKATLVWTDVAGATNTGGLDSSTPALVNDLDLWITDSLNNTYFPWTVDPNNPNGAALRIQRNSLDNVEQVLVDNFLASSTFTVHVGLHGSLTGAAQNFSLLVNFGDAVPEPTTLMITIVAGAVLLRSRRSRR